MANDEADDLTGSKKSKPVLSRKVQAELGQRLRHFYETLALGESPVPDRFIEIINQIEDNDHTVIGQRRHHS